MSHRQLALFPRRSEKFLNPCFANSGWVADRLESYLVEIGLSHPIRGDRAPARDAVGGYPAKAR